MITFTQSAKDRLLKICDEDNMFGVVNVRVGVRGGGCSGFSHVIFFAEKDPDDVDYQDLITSDDKRTINVICDPLSLQYLEGTMIDFISTLQTSGFKFTNENIKGTCGCGSSIQY